LNADLFFGIWSFHSICLNETEMSGDLEMIIEEGGVVVCPASSSEVAKA
jgi:hypothetical protein